MPRIFIFDSCDGDNAVDPDWRSETKHNDEEDEISSKEEKAENNQSHATSKGLKQLDINEDINILVTEETHKLPRATTKDIVDGDTDDGTESLWHLEEHNPDHKLVTIFAANPGFQATMSSEQGSYLIQEFVDRMIINYFEDGNKLVFGEIMDKIESNLHDVRKKQLIKQVYHNQTRYIKFIKNTQERANQNTASNDVKKGEIENDDNQLEHEHEPDVNDNGNINTNNQLSDADALGYQTSTAL